MGAHPPALCVLNKSDMNGSRNDPDVAAGLRTVATTGEGVDALSRAIKRRFLGAEPLDLGRARWWTERQRALLERALSEQRPIAGT
jgi:hypothetical protein